MQAREDPLKRITKRPSDERYSDVTDRKRSSGADSRFEAPPPPRFDASLVSSRSYDKKRDDYNSSSTSKRGIDDYSSATKRLDYTKRDDYSSSGTKRSAIDDYSSVPAKRSSDDYNKRSDYLSTTSTKRGGGLDDYTSSKSSRDEYKREVEIRHIPASGGGGSGSFHSSRDASSSMHKSGGGSRYVDSDRTTSGNYRRGGGGGGMDDLRTSFSGNKRYDSSGGYGGSSGSGNNVWASTSSHLSLSTHATGGSGAPTLKSYVSNGISNIHGGSTWQKSVTVEESNWRPVQSQDRYDRTYNERGYSGSTMYGSSGRPGQDRYGAQVSSRY